MLQRHTILCIVVLSLLATGCPRHARTTITSTAEPVSHGEYRKVLVMVGLDDVFLRTKAERVFAVKLRAHGIEAVVSVDFFPADKPPDVKEMNEMMMRSGIDGALFFVLKDYNTEQVMDKRGLAAAYLLSRPPSQMRGTYSPVINVPATYSKVSNIIVEITFRDVKLSKNVWTARTTTQGNRKAGEEELIMSIADEAEKRLQEDGFLK